MASSTAIATSTYLPAIITSFPLNPLTTTFTPPADCSGLYRSSVSSGPNPFMVDLRLSCLPSGASTQATDYFSPGIACPSGYYTACHDTDGVASITTVTCCPFRGDVTLSCVNLASIAGVFNTLFCTWAALSLTTIAVTLSSNGGTTSTVNASFTSPGGFNAFGVRMVYQSTDLMPSSTISASPTTGVTSSASSTSQPVVSTSPASTGSTSTGTIAIAVVIPVAALAVLGVVYMWWRKRRQQRKSPQGITSEFHGELNNELPSHPAKLSNYVHTTPAELPAEGPR